jgi:hypothetical protein
MSASGCAGVEVAQFKRWASALPPTRWQLSSWTVELDRRGTVQRQPHQTVFQILQRPGAWRQREPARGLIRARLSVGRLYRQ